MNFDEKPVGQHNDIAVTEFSTADNSDKAPDQDKSSGPLADRLVNKNPKIRIDAMTELYALSDSNLEQFSIYCKNFPKYLADKHPGVQEKAVDCLLAAISKSSTPVDEALADCIGVLFEKCFTSSKAQTKAKAVECFLALAEHENAHTVIKEDLKKFMTLKTNPKVSAGAIQVATQLMSSFGHLYFPVKEFMNAVTALSESTNAQVRTEAMNYFKEGYKWDKENVLKVVEKLRQAQQEELKKQFIEINEVPKVIRFVKGKENQIVEAIQEKVTDSYVTAAEVSVLKKFNDSWCTQIMDAKKWTEKRDKLEELLKAVSVERMKNESFSELGKTLKLLLQDPNIVVSNLILKIIGQLAKALRSHFAGYSKLIFPCVVQKYKDKKSAGEAQKCMENLMLSIKIEDMIELIKEALGDKSPLIKAKVCLWIESSVIPNVEVTFSKTISEEIGPILARLTEDAVSDVRESSLACFGTILKTLPSNATLERMLNDFNAQKKEKIKSMLTSNKLERDSNQCIVQSNCTQEINKVKIAEIVVKPAPKKQSVKNVKVELEEDKAESIMSQEEVEKVIVEKLPLEIRLLFDKEDWKERQKGIESFINWVKESEVQNILEPIVLWTKVKLNNFKESNPTLLKSSLLLLQALADKCIFNEVLTQIILPILIEKMSDTKVVDTCIGIVMSIADSVGPSYVSDECMKYCQDSKSIYVIKGTISLLSKMIEEFGSNNVSSRATVDFVKQFLLHTNVQVRTVVIRYLCLVYAAVGNTVRDWLANDLKDSIKKTLETEFSKVKFQPTSMKRTLKGKAIKCTVQCKSQPESSINISSLISLKLISDLSDPDISKRQEAKKSIEGLLATNKKVLPIGLHPLINSLSSRMKDPCKDLARGFIGLIGNLAVAMGEGFKEYGKVIMQALINSVVIKQIDICKEIMITLNKISSVINPEAMLIDMLSIIDKDNFDSQSFLLSWILSNKECIRKCELEGLVKMLIRLLQSELKETNQLAEEVLKEIVNTIGYETCVNMIKNIQPIENCNIEVFIDKYKPIKVNTLKEDTIPKVINSKKPQECLVRESEEQRTTSKVNKKEVEPQSMSKLKERLNETIRTTSRVKGRPNRQGREDLKNNNEKSLADEQMQRTQNRLSEEMCQQTKEFRKKTDRAKTRLKGRLLEREQINNTIIESHVKKLIVLTLGNKDKRNAATKWSINESHIEKLKKSFKTLVHPELFENMFSNQFKKNLAALKALTDSIKTEYNDILDLLDLFFKWMMINMVDQSNTAIGKAVMEFLDKMLSRMIESDYHMYDFEVASILPMLIDRIVTNFKDQVKVIIGMICQLYNPSKVASQIVNAIEVTKNQKTKVECLILMKELAVKHGASKVCSSKCVKMLVKIAEKSDKPMKDASFTLLEEVYKSRGDGIWDIISRIPEKTKEILRSRFATVRITESGQSFYSNSISNTTLNCSSMSIDPREMSMKKLTLIENASMKNLMIKEAKTPLNVSKRPALATERSVKPLGQHNATVKVKAKCSDLQTEKKNRQISEFGVLDELMNLLRCGEVSKRVGVLMYLNEKIISPVYSDREILISNCDLLVSTFAEVLKESFNKVDDEIPVRFLKYFITMVSKVCNDKAIMRKVNIKSFLSFAEQLILALLHTGMEKLGDDEGVYLTKTLNLTMLRVLENCDSTDSFIVLIELYKKHKDVDHTNGKIKIEKLTHLIIKCILKLTKIMPSLSSLLDVPRLLICIYKSLLIDIDDDIGIRVAKTIVNELVKAKGKTIWDCYKEAEESIKGDTHIKRWIDIILKNNTNCPQQEELRKILKQFSVKGKLKEAVKALSEYLKQHPNTDISPYFDSCSKDFKNYVMNSLQKNLLNENESTPNNMNSAKTSLMEYKSKLAILKEKLSSASKTDSLV